MKKCPFCQQDIEDGSTKCIYCGGPINEDRPQKWYYRTGSLVFAFLLFGPLMLPLVWYNPDMTRKKKIIFTIAIVFITAVLVLPTVYSIRNLQKYYREMFELLK